MIIDTDELASLVAPHGIVPLYSNSGRYDFSPGCAVRRAALTCEHDDTICPELRASCLQLADLDAVASNAAGHLAECGVAPLYLVPQIHWEHELHDHAPSTWHRVFELAEQRADDPRLTGGNAMVLLPGQTPLAAILAALLRGITQASVMILADRPLIVKIHHHRQIWFSSTDPDLLPTKGVFNG